MSRRSRVGEANPNAVLDEAAVKRIRKAYATGKTSYPRLAKQFGVSTSTVFQIVKRQIWGAVE